jgi:hypothetical protein
MARGLWVSLRRWGFDFRQIGPEKDYHGIRAPYVLDLSAFGKKMAKTNTEFARMIHSIGQNMRNIRLDG